MPDRRHPRGAAMSAPPQLVRAGHARHDHPVVAVELDRLVAERLHGDEGLAHDVMSLGSERLRELLVATFRPRQEDPHRASARSSAASAAGSFPERRSIQLPSSAATSAVSVVPSWWAATGARHPPPIVATQARSASTRRLVSVSSAPATGCSSPARTWSARAPWPASGNN